MGLSKKLISKKIACSVITNTGFVATKNIDLHHWSGVADLPLVILKSVLESKPLIIFW